MTPPPRLPGLLASLAPVLDNYGYLAVAGLVLIEDFGVPVPGETVLIAAAVYAGAGRLNVWAVGVIALVAAIAGDNIGYLIGRSGGRALVLRLGRWVRLTAGRLDHAESFFRRHGGKIVTVARFIEGLRQANGLIAGITRMPWRSFIGYNAAGALLWVSAWTCVGYFAGRHLTGIYHAITGTGLYLLAGLAALVAGWLVYRWRRRRSATARVPGPADRPEQP